MITDDHTHTKKSLDCTEKTNDTTALANKTAIGEAGHAPVVKEHSLLVMNATMDAISEMRPHRFIGILSVMYFTCSAGIAATIAVSTTAGAKALHVIPAAQR